MLLIQALIAAFFTFQAQGMRYMYYFGKYLINQATTSFSKRYQTEEKRATWLFVVCKG